VHIVIACIILSPNQSIALTLNSKTMFLSVNRSKIAIIMVSVVLIIRDGKEKGSSHSVVRES